MKKFKRFQILLLVLLVSLGVLVIQVIDISKVPDNKNSKTTQEFFKPKETSQLEPVNLDETSSVFIKQTDIFGPHHLESRFFKVERDVISQIPCRLRLKTELIQECSFTNTSINLDKVIVEDLNGDGNYEIAETIDGFIPDCEGLGCRYAGVVAIYTFKSVVLEEIGDKATYDEMFRELERLYPKANLTKSISHWQ